MSTVSFWLCFLSTTTCWGGVGKKSLGHKPERGGTSSERTTPEVYTHPRAAQCTSVLKERDYQARPRTQVLPVLSQELPTHKDTTLITHTRSCTRLAPCAPCSKASIVRPWWSARWPFFPPLWLPMPGTSQWSLAATHTQDHTVLCDHQD